jgi:glyoxylase-like metal-dependent hydrolase (beta-lactamase superfamily II)
MTGGGAIRVGAAELRRVEEIVVKRPLAALTDDRRIIDDNWHWLYPDHVAPDGSWDMVVQSWLLTLGGRVIVVDPCVGNGRSFPALAMFDRLDTPYIDRFAATGVRPEDVDFVFCTHFHMDHCGWNTGLRGGRYVPTFPNARYVMVRREFDRWDPARPGHVPSLPNAGVYENSILPVLEAGLADIVGDRHRIVEGLAIEPAYGHTAGHSALHLRSGGEHAYFTGDLFHHPLELIHPEIDRHVCEDFAATYAARRRLIAKFLERDALVVPAHFGAPYAGWLRGGEGALRYEPVRSPASPIPPPVSITFT